MRRDPAWLKIVAFLTDFALIHGAFLLAYWMRYTQEVGREVVDFLPWESFIPVQLGLSTILILGFLLAGLYYRPLQISLVDEVASILGVTSMGVMITLAIIFLSQGFAYSRLLFIFAWGLIIGFLITVRVARRLLLFYLRRKGLALKRVLVVGGDTLGKMVMHIMATEPGRGKQLVGFLADDITEDLGRFKWLGKISDLPDLLHQHDVDEVIITMPSGSRHQIMKITDHCQDRGVGFRIAPDLYELSLTGVNVDDLRGIPLIGMKPVSIQGTNLLLKRAMDVVFSLAILLLLSPLWVIIAFLIKITSPGPVFFKQVRLGKDGKSFVIYKFRSMKVTAEEEREHLDRLNEATAPLFKIRNDPRLTFIGSILRRTSLDEIPQFLNVFKGEMSLVGPRPPLPSEVNGYAEWHRKRLEVAPGITGLWQVSGRSELPFDEMVMLDIYYIENWSLSLDTKIVLRTLPAIISGQGAY